MKVLKLWKGVSPQTGTTHGVGTLGHIGLFSYWKWVASSSAMWISKSILQNIYKYLQMTAVGEIYYKLTSWPNA